MQTVFLAKVGPADPAQALLNQAIAFFNAGSRCIAGISLSPTVVNCPQIPAVVCYAFAAELYLKLLCTITVGKPKKTHGIAGLFDALPEDTRRKVAEKYELGAEDLLEHIKTVDSAFVDWRYVYEMESISINPQILIILSKAVHLVCRELRPELQSM